MTSPEAENPDSSPSATGETPFTADLSVIRQIAGAIPGALPTAINGVRFAASIRPWKFVIAGGDETPVSMPRTAFQLVYPSGTVMLDAGMNKATHESFGGGEPFYPDEFARLERALNAARLIVLTHYHADHVAGVLKAPNFAALARKTLVTFDTLDLMVNRPHRPDLKLAADRAGAFIAMDYRAYHPVAPGLVLIKAPGHSPDMQMAYIRLHSGQEFLHCIDAAWNMENIRQLKGKAAPWVKEDVAAVNGQLRWLNGILRTEKAITVLVTHDDALFSALSEAKRIGALEA